MKKQDNKITEVKQEIVPMNAETLIAQAIDKGVPVDVMERILAMRRELRAEQAKEAFDRAMASFQKECPTIKKTKSVDYTSKKTGFRTHYSYAPLESIVEQVKELLAKNNFSYTFDSKKTNNAFITFCHVKHIAGHSDVSQFEIAVDDGATMNISQKDGSANSYGKRYAFCNAFGILTGDEDNDGQTSSEEKNPSTPREMRQTQEKNAGGHLVTEKQVNYIRSLLKEKGYTENQLLEKYETSSLHQLSSEQASIIIGNLMKLPTKKVEPVGDFSTILSPEDEIDLDVVDEGIKKSKAQQILSAN